MGFVTLGLKNVRRAGVQEFPDVTFRGQPAPTTMKKAFVEIAGVTIQWIQPVKGTNAYSEFLREHGDGVQHLAYAVPSPESLEAELQHFASKGVEVIQRGSWEGEKGRGLFAYLDTAPSGGGITLELTYDPDAATAVEPRASGHEYPFSKIVQYAFVVRDLKPVSAFYEGLGLGALDVGPRLALLDREYYGKPSPHAMDLGWDRRGDVPFEWIEPAVPPTIYQDALEKSGEGFHHLAFDVDDMDEAIRLFEAKGATLTQSGTWDLPTSRGRYAYLDTERHGGVAIELLWNDPDR